MTVLIYLFKWHLRIIYLFIKIFTKQDSKKILFLSRQSNNPSIDFELLEKDIHKRYPEYKVVILTKKLEKKNFIKYYFHIYKQMHHIATSKVILLDTYIIPISILKHKKGTTIIQLCHGIGNIKKFAYQTLKNESGKGEKLSKLMQMHEKYDYLISTSDETSKFYAEAFNMPLSKIVPIGNPKIDYILNLPSKKKEVLKNYPNLKDKPVILYVSTFRTYDDDYLKRFIKNAPLDKYNIIINSHPVTYKYHPEIEKYLTDNRIYRCKEFSTQELLSVADIAITDYSSFVFESAILEVPTYLYVPDYDKYTSKNGLNVDIFKELPGLVYKDVKSLFKRIEKGNYDLKIIKNFKNKYVSNCDGNATKKLTDFMIEKIK